MSFRDQRPHFACTLFHSHTLSSTTGARSVALVLFGKFVARRLARLNLSLGDDLLDDIILILGPKLSPSALRFSLFSNPPDSD